VGELLKTLHLVRKPVDELAWEAIQVSAKHGEIRVVLMQDAAGGEPPPGIAAVSSPPVNENVCVPRVEPIVGKPFTLEKQSTSLLISRVRPESLTKCSDAGFAGDTQKCKPLATTLDTTVHSSDWTWTVRR